MDLVFRLVIQAAIEYVSYRLLIGPLLHHKRGGTAVSNRIALRINGVKTRNARLGFGALPVRVIGQKSLPLLLRQVRSNFA